MSRASALAEAVKDILNTVEFSQEFTAIRAYRAFYSLKDLAVLKVTVLAPLTEQLIAGRKGNFDNITVEIVVQKQVDPTDNTALDLLADLVEEIAENFRGTRTKSWGWLGTEIAVPYDINDLSEWRVFTAVVRLRYQIAWIKS